MHELVIRGGTIVDGAGAAAYTGDVAIDEDRISALGKVVDKGRREIDADGLLVTPGWVDIHTHYDGQVTWDSQVAPSSLHGVTSVVYGNCGVGFAPARTGEDDHAFLISLMEGVEDIPGTALAEGLAWDWESIPEYLDAVDRRPHTIDLGAQVPHAALRAYVMGARGANHEEDPTPEEIGRMAELTAEALEAGAVGFATSRTLNHRTKTGQKIGSLTASSEELLGIADALRRTGKGVLQVVSDFKSFDYEMGMMRRMAELSGRPLSVSLIQADQRPDRWRDVLAYIDRAAADGLDMKAQIAARPVGLLVGLNGSMHPYVKTPTYKAQLRGLPVAEQARRMRDPELRAALLAEAREVRGGLFAGVAKQAHKLFELGDPPEYEPAPEQSIAAKAQRAGVDPMELVYDILTAGDGDGMLYYPAGNYSAGNLDAAREMVLHERTVPGLSDGGAHVSFICDASFPTYNIVHWARDRSRGEKLPLEFMVKRQTLDTARHVGWNDRGRLAVGCLADVNVIDFDRLALRPPEMVHDLPAGGKRLMQKAEGYRYTIKRGQVTFVDGVATGVLPGQVVRGAQAAPTA
ncbi:MAG: N-acyl-D-amino-acid deacylase family protein [Acidimicrobiales bacterium]